MMHMISYLFAFSYLNDIIVVCFPVFMCFSVTVLTLANDLALL